MIDNWGLKKTIPTGQSIDKNKKYQKTWNFPTPTLSITSLNFTPFKVNQICSLSVGWVLTACQVLSGKF